MIFRLDKINLALIIQLGLLICAVIGGSTRYRDVRSIKKQDDHAVRTDRLDNSESRETQNFVDSLNIMDVKQVEIPSDSQNFQSCAEKVSDQIVAYDSQENIERVKEALIEYIETSNATIPKTSLAMRVLRRLDQTRADGTCEDGNPNAVIINGRLTRSDEKLFLLVKFVCIAGGVMVATIGFIAGAYLECYLRCLFQP